MIRRYHIYSSILSTPFGVESTTHTNEIMSCKKRETRTLPEIMPNEESTAETLQPRERCPRCSSLLSHESRDPLEEFCIEPACDYYRAEGTDGTVLRE
jgi:hypothetical protein